MANDVDNDGCFGLFMLLFIACTFLKTCSIDNKVDRIETMMEKSLQNQIKMDSMIHKIDSLNFRSKKNNK